MGREAGLGKHSAFSSDGLSHWAPSIEDTGYQYYCMKCNSRHGGLQRNIGREREIRMLICPTCALKGDKIENDLWGFPKEKDYRNGPSKGRGTKEDGRGDEGDLGEEGEA